VLDDHDGVVGWSINLFNDHAPPDPAPWNPPLTSADVQEAHRLAAKNVSPEAGNYRITGEGKEPLIGAGGIGFAQAWTSLSPEQIAVMQSNPHLRLLERNAMNSLLTPDQIAAKFETAIIAYPDASTVTSRVDEFFTWCATHRGSMDPVDFAAAAQQHLVSIHPFVDGNGRLSRLIMDHALQSRGLPTALLGDVNIDYMVSQATWAGEVRRGVMETYRTAATYAGVFNQGLQEANPHKIAAAWAALLSLDESPEQVATLLYGPQDAEGSGGK
jgi:prophage maintenance system killer protein